MVERKEGFRQVAVIEGVIVKNGKELEDFFKEKFDIDIQFLETIKTKPSKDSEGREIPGTGGRTDVFFAIHNKDVMKFAVPRFTIQARWLEDCVSDINNPNGIIYPEKVLDYVEWNEENIKV